jgi:GGDEF domain-containing protein
MARKSTERRAAELKPLPKSYKGTGEQKIVKGTVRLRDPETGFYTRPALAEFIQYEIDGSAQTMMNELYVTPLCLAAVAFEGTGGSAEERFMTVGEAIRKLTRASDRVARDGDVFLLLLRRTLAKNVQEHYAGRLAETVNDALKDMGGAATLSLGVSSLVEHLVRDPEDMVRKAMRALEEARKEPGSCVIYDFRVMPLD